MRFVVLQGTVAGCVALSILFLAVGISTAQEGNVLTAGIARTYTVADEMVEVGDIIAYDNESKSYRLALSGDKVLVGVVVENPIIAFETASGGVLAAATGEVLLNVSTLGGPIAIGDLVAASPLPGKAWQAQPGDRAVGVAREPFNVDVASTTFEHEGTRVGVGSIVVLLDTSGTAFSKEGDGQNSDVAPQGTIPELFKYVLAFAIAIGSLYISFKNFGANIRNGILSIGRNPLARGSIQAMVVLNIILIVLVGGGGLFLGLAILLLPV